jgi:oligopeptide transport system substrate-binding protein
LKEENMMSRKTTGWALSVLAVLSLIITACGGATPTPVTIVQTAAPVVQTSVVVQTGAPVVQTSVVQVTAPAPSGPKTLMFNLGFGDIPTIDPALATDTSSNQVVELVTVGLTRQNEETAELLPGMAESWEFSEDGSTITFNLIDNVPWVRYNPGTDEVEVVKDADGNDRMVTANDFAYGILRTLNPETGSEYAYVLATVIAGAADYNGGTITDTASVGVNVVDDHTLEITLVEDAAGAAYIPNIMGMWIAHAMPQWIIEERGDRWTETGFQQSYGPYTLKSWNHDSDLTLIKNPHWPGIESSPQAKIEEVVFTMLDESPAFAAYETGELHVTGVPLTEIDRVKADATLSKELKIAPILCTYYYGFNVEKAPFDDARVRRAFSMAVDRQTLIDNVTKGGQEPAQWFARPGLTAAPTMETHPDLGIQYDPEGAKALLDEVYPDRSQMPPVTLSMNQVEGHVKIGEAIAAMWNEVLGVEVTLQTQEWQVYLQTLTDDPPQIWRLGWCQDYPDANNFLKEVFRSDSSQNNTRWGNEEYDRIVDEAATLDDEEERRELYAQAEEILVDTDAAIIPIYWYTTVVVTKPEVQRTFSVLGGLQHIEKWDITGG